MYYYYYAVLYTIMSICIIKWRLFSQQKIMKVKDITHYSTTNKKYVFLCALNLLRISNATITTDPVPECAKSGIRMGAGLGALAGGTAGAALISHIGVGSMTLATCPTLALTTMAGAGTGIVGGPLVPIGIHRISTKT